MSSHVRPAAVNLPQIAQYLGYTKEKYPCPIFCCKRLYSLIPGVSLYYSVVTVRYLSKIIKLMKHDDSTLPLAKLLYKEEAYNVLFKTLVLLGMTVAGAVALLAHYHVMDHIFSDNFETLEIASGSAFLLGGIGYFGRWIKGYDEIQKEYDTLTKPTTPSYVSDEEVYSSSGNESDDSVDNSALMPPMVATAHLEGDGALASTSPDEDPTADRRLHPDFRRGGYNYVPPQRGVDITDSDADDDE